MEGKQSSFPAAFRNLPPPGAGALHSSSGAASQTMETPLLRKRLWTAAREPLGSAGRDVTCGLGKASVLPGRAAARLLPAAREAVYGRDGVTSKVLVRSSVAEISGNV